MDNYTHPGRPKYSEHIFTKTGQLEILIRNMADQSEISNIDAAKLIISRQDLLKRAADEIGTDESDVLTILTREIEDLEREYREQEQQQ